MPEATQRMKRTLLIVVFPNMLYEVSHNIPWSLILLRSASALRRFRLGLQGTSGQYPRFMVYPVPSSLEPPQMTHSLKL